VWPLGAAFLLLAMSGVSVADDWSRWHQRDNRYDQQAARDNRKLYDRGFKDGQKDRQHRRPFQIRSHHFDGQRQREAYVSGYRAGYGSGVYRRRV
jgi:hypothetical protein